MRKRFLVLAAVFGTSILGASFNFGGDRAYATVPYVNERVSTTGSGGQITDGGFNSGSPAISGDGRYVAFISTSTQLVASDTNALADIFVKDRQSGSITRANTNSSGVQMATGTVYANNISISNNGRYVAFIGWQTGLVSGFTGTARSVLVKDMQTGAIDVADLTSSGNPANGDASSTSLSADGRYVTFMSAATNLASSDTNASRDVFVRDRLLGTTTLLSKSYSSGTASNGQTTGPPSISCDGAYIAFASSSSDLISNDINGYTDVFLVDRINNTVKDITLAANAASSSTYPHLSCDGTTLVFSSPASNLVSGDTNGFSDIFVYNTYANATERVSLSSSGSQATRDVETTTSNSDVSYDGQYIVFYSDSNGLVGSDTNGYQDIYIINRKNSTIELLSMRNASTQTTGSSNLSTISADGRYVTYYSEDDGLVTGDTNSRPDMFVSETGL